MRRTLAVTGFAAGLFIAATAYSQVTIPLTGDITVDLASPQISLKEAYEICKKHITSSCAVSPNGKFSRCDEVYEWPECEGIAGRWNEELAKTNKERYEADHALIRKWLGKP